MYSSAQDESGLLLEYFEETTGRGVLIIDRFGQARFANTKLYAFFNLDPDTLLPGMSFTACMELLGKSQQTIDNQEQFFKLIKPITAGQEHKTRLFLQTGVWVSISGKPMKKGGYVITITDITKTRQAFDHLKRTQLATIMGLADLAENRDSDTGAHVLKVARMTQEIAWELQAADYNMAKLIDDTFMQNVAIASVLHDIGKVTTPDRILLKPGKLDHEERSIMSMHAKAGWDIIIKMSDYQEGSHSLTMASNIALSHHEKFSGGGYPQGISGEQIPLEARIVAVCDVFDALISWRPYKTPWSQEDATGLIKNNAGTMFDPKVVAAFLKVMEKRAATDTMQWHEKMSVGIPAMDNDHKTLISLINQLADARQRNDPIIVELVIEELLNYTIRHFQSEEQLLIKRNFPLSNEHQQAHKQFAEQVVAMRKQFLKENSSEQGEELTELVRSWLQRHILVEDKKYCQFFAKQEATTIQ